MILRGLSILLTLSVLVSCTKDKNPETISGEEIDLSKSRSALVWLAPDCPLCQSYSTSFSDLSDKFGDRINFYGVIAGDHYTQDEIEFYKDSFDFTPRVLKDSDFSLTRALSATVTPEFFLLDSGKQVVYRGKFDDWATDLSRKKIKPTAHYFKDAIESMLHGDVPVIQSTSPIGCAIEFD